jgi:hypothetical protein
VDIVTVPEGAIEWVMAAVLVPVTVLESVDVIDIDGEKVLETVTVMVTVMLIEDVSIEDTDMVSVSRSISDGLVVAERVKTGLTELAADREIVGVDENDKIADGVVLAEAVCVELTKVGVTEPDTGPVLVGE